MYYIHRRTPDIEIEQVMDTLLGFKAKGKIGGIGFSEISPASLRRACAVGLVDAVQIECSLWSRGPELGMLQACTELDVAFVPFSPVGRGIFAQKTPDPATFQDTDFGKDTPRFTEPNFEYNIAKIDAFKALARNLGTHPTSLAITWCLHRGPHLIPIPGTRSSAHLSQCAEAGTFMMTAAIMTEIETILPVGWTHGDRYTKAQWNGPEGYY